MNRPPRPREDPPPKPPACAPRASTKAAATGTSVAAPPSSSAAPAASESPAPCVPHIAPAAEPERPSPLHLQILSSGSEGNSTLIRCGELTVLVDAGLTMRALTERLEAARIAQNQVDHVVLTHAHLDHARSAGIVGKRHGAIVHCPEAMMQNRSVARAPRLSTLPVGGVFELEVPGSDEALKIETVPLPHDCDPTVAMRLSHAGRTAIILTDCGHPRHDLKDALQGANVLVLEFNHDPVLMETSPYPPKLRKRILGDQGHLSNAQAQALLRELVGPDLHTLFLAHLSGKTNTPDLALSAAKETLEELGRLDVDVQVALQHEVGPNLEV